MEVNPKVAAILARMGQTASRHFTEESEPKIRDYSRAAQEGRQAAINGALPFQCPFRGDAAKAWHRGFTIGRILDGAAASIPHITQSVRQAANLRAAYIPPKPEIDDTPVKMPHGHIRVPSRTKKPFRTSKLRTGGKPVCWIRPGNLNGESIWIVGQVGETISRTSNFIYALLAAMESGLQIDFDPPAKKEYIELSKAIYPNRAAECNRAGVKDILWALHESGVLADLKYGTEVEEEAQALKSDLDVDYFENRDLT